MQGEPRSSCEREEWYELAPARSEVREGVAAFLYAQDDAVLLEDVWPKLEEPELERRHRARIEPVDSAERRALYQMLGALGALVVGVGGASLAADESPTLATALGVSGLVLGARGMLAAAESQPSDDELLHAETRRRLFIPGEDDLVAAARGVDRANARRRASCGATPAAPATPEVPTGVSSGSPIARVRPAAAAPGAP